MVVSQNSGTPTQTPKYYNPYYRDTQKGTPNFGKPRIYDHIIIIIQLLLRGGGSTEALGFPRLRVEG